MNTRLARIPVVGVALLAIGACQSTPSTPSSSGTPSADAPATVELANDFSSAAEVVAVDKAARIVSLRRQDGTLIGVHAGESVRNFDQIAVGNKLRVRYRQTLTAVRSTGSATATPSDAKVALAAGRAPAGDKPAAAVLAGVQFAVKIESLDLAHDIVVGSLESGELIAHRLATPQGRAFAKGLKLGDQVELTYREALALSIEQM
jgi:hypothetical protein